MDARRARASQGGRTLPDMAPGREPTPAFGWVAPHVAAEFPGLAVLTGDALLADRALCQAIVESGRDYLFRVKKTNRISTKHASSSSLIQTASPI